MGGPGDAWDRDYRRRGRRWAGESRDLPGLETCTRVLEAGCGDGKTLRSLARLCQTPPGEGDPLLVGLDLSRAALHLCARDLAGSPGIHLACADAARMPFAGSSFDAVLLIHLLGHVPTGTRRLVLREAERVVKTGGRVVIRVFSTRDFRCGKGDEIGEMTFLRGDGTFTHYFTKDEVLDLCSGLSVLSVRDISWTMRIRGRDLLREEIQAVLCTR